MKKMLSLALDKLDDFFYIVNTNRALFIAIAILSTVALSLFPVVF